MRVPVRTLGEWGCCFEIKGKVRDEMGVLHIDDTAVTVAFGRFTDSRVVEGSLVGVRLSLAGEPARAQTPL
jgi:hypothetical protein